MGGEADGGVARRGDGCGIIETEALKVPVTLRNVQMSGPRGTKKASCEPWPNCADLETGMAYVRELMDGYGL
jgi:hypothetical protein